MARSYWLSGILLLTAIIDAKEPTVTKQQTDYPFTGKVTGNKVRLRSAPHSDGAIIAELHKDDYVKIIGEQAGFYMVAPPNGMKMYIYRTYVFDQTVDANNVNVRLAPSLEAPIAAQLHAGDKVIGKPSSQNPKWIEIDPPQTAKLYVSRDYIDRVGGGDFLEQQVTAREQAQSILLQSYQAAQNEIAKPFDQMHIEPLIEQLNKASLSWQEMPEHKKRAEELKNLLEESYKSRRLTWLEEKAAAAEKLSQEERRAYEIKIQGLQEQLKSQKEDLVVAMEAKAPDPVLALSAPEESLWGSVELVLQKRWLTAHCDKTSEDYQKAQLEASQSLRGVVSPYKASSKKAPGDYVLMINEAPVAFLYSPFVDLNVVAGKEVALTAVPRDNNLYAYPAYCVIQIKHGTS